jgi:hypothetical protein
MQDPRSGAAPRSRYADQPDGLAEGEDGSGNSNRQPQRAPSPLTETNSSRRQQLHRHDFRLMCANERLYEAYSELHSMCQGAARCAWVSTQQQQQQQQQQHTDTRLCVRELACRACRPAHAAGWMWYHCMHTPHPLLPCAGTCRL